MKCPACFNELTEFQLGDLTVDVCQGACGGIWLDAFELQKLDDARQETEEILLNIHRDEHLSVDKSLKRKCPRCAGIKLHRHYFSAKRRVEVDQCPNCAGYWLDAGELALIRAEQSQTATALRVGQGSLSSDVIRYLYRLQTEQRGP
jgi:uncharacterized protein